MVLPSECLPMPPTIFGIEKNRICITRKIGRLSINNFVDMEIGIWQNTVTGLPAASVAAAAAVSAPPFHFDGWDRFNKYVSKFVD
jgi:hypothetical protein